MQKGTVTSIPLGMEETMYYQNKTYVIRRIGIADLIKEYSSIEHQSAETHP